MVELYSDKYGKMMAYSEYNRTREQYELTVFLKTPIHLYDFVDYVPEGWGTRYKDGKPGEKVWSNEYIGDKIYSYPRNMRFDFVYDAEDITLELLEGLISKEFEEALEEDDGKVGFTMIMKRKGN